MWQEAYIKRVLFQTSLFFFLHDHQYSFLFSFTFYFVCSHVLILCALISLFCVLSLQLYLPFRRTYGHVEMLSPKIFEGQGLLRRQLLSQGDTRHVSGVYVKWKTKERNRTLRCGGWRANEMLCSSNLGR